MHRIATIVVMVLGLVLVPSTAFGQQYPIAAEGEDQDFGVQVAGDTFDKQDCGFQPGTTADIRPNDTAADTKQVGSDGCVRLTVRIVDQDTVSIDDREYDARRCASNTIFVTAPVAGGAAEQRQMRNHFTILCAATKAGPLPRTGNDIADLAALGGVLVVVGATVVTIVRRRRRSAAGGTT